MPESEPVENAGALLTAPEQLSGPPPCRAALAHWPVEWRERWGRRANALEESGLSWHEAEARAFIEVWKERRAWGQSPPPTLTSAQAECN